MSFRNVLKALRDGEVSLDEAKQEILTQRTESTPSRKIKLTEVELPTSDRKAEVPPTSSEAVSVLIEPLQQELIISLAAALYMEQSEIKLDHSFVDMGLDSIVGVEWIAAINKQYDITIAATKVYDYPNLEEFSRFLKKEIEKNGSGVLQATPPQISSPAVVEPEPFALDPLPSIARSTSPQAKAPQPEALGSPIFQERYGCRFSYFAGSMYRGIASEKLVVAMGKANLLSFFGSAGFENSELQPRIQTIQSQLAPHQPYGVCLISNLNHPEEEMKQAELFVQYGVPIIEAAAFSSITPALVFCRVNGLTQSNGRIVFPRRIIAKCSRLEVARLFTAPAPLNIVNDLLAEGMISSEEARLSQLIPVVDDLAVEADSGGHTDQGVAFALIPSIVFLKDSMMRKYNYQEEILVGCGGGIGTPQSVVAAFALGADFIFTGSINQCTVESGAHDVVKEILSTVSIHDTTTAPAGDMFEIGAKVQVLRKGTRFPGRANRLYQLFQQYDSIDDMPPSVLKEIEKNIFKRTFADVWEQVCEYKKKKNPEQIDAALENPRVKMKLIFQWYFVHTNMVTLNGDESEKDNFQIHCGPAMGAFNQWVQGTGLEDWKNRHVDQISVLLMSKACEYMQKQPWLIPAMSPPRGSAGDAVVSRPSRQPPVSNEDIAVIGMAGQFPEARDLDQFWENLSQGKNCISEIPETRWSIDKYYDADKDAPGKTNCKWMGVLEEVDLFDPLFFNISPSEAEWMDPQQRLFLQNAWRCIEDAGLPPSYLSGSSCGVFVGCGGSEYGPSPGAAARDAQGLMGASASILSARISYLLNLKGPCLAIDTACSSSLVAIAEACNSLILGTSDLALAGGVYVLSGPGMHIMAGKAGMLSDDGRCFTFDQRANGFVPGEGVGVVLLKRLADAIEDGDQIHGVIKGWGINQDGKTNGITAPSVNSQMALEKGVYERFQINPETISMVEAHGTGTKLGDPIEMEALIEAFRAFTDKQGYCAVGSVKSNIGHLLPAAGVAGVIKVLLALRYNMLPPTINFEELNQHIFLDDSPFYINAELRPWEQVAGRSRRACVSSFGFSGTNAHMVIEEYRGAKSEIPSASASRPPALILLSAKTADRLKEAAKNLLTYVNASLVPNPAALHDVAYTLQVGREAMDERLGFIVESVEELIEKLSGYIDGRQQIRGLYRGQVKRNQEALSAFAADEDLAHIMDVWVNKGKYAKLVDVWAKGLTFDWNRLYDEHKPKRISLPTYPFARERYWIEARPLEASVESSASIKKLHPLVHENTSNFQEQRFSSTFTGEEFFLVDHGVKGEKALSGIASLEMARAALEKASGLRGDSQTGITLNHIVWAHPIVVNRHAKDVHIGLFPEGDGRIQYEIYSDDENAESESTVHSQGSATFSTADNIPPLDLPGLKSKMHLNDSHFTHPAIEEWYVGEDYALAKITLPESVSKTLDQFVLHPSIMEAALKASQELMERSVGDLSAVDSLEIHTPCADPAWVLIHRTNTTLDLDLCDEQGLVCVRMKGFSFSVRGSDASSEAVGTLMLHPRWQEQRLSGTSTVVEYAEHLVVLCESEEGLEKTLEAKMQGVRCLRLSSEQKGLEKRYETYVLQVFEAIQIILKTKPRGKVLVQVVVPSDDERRVFRGLSGLLQTAHLENPRIQGQLIEVAGDESEEALLNKVEENSLSQAEAHIRYQGGKRMIYSWEEVPVLEEAARLPWKEKGVYLITGGVGGLGLIFAREIASRIEEPTLILTGRSVLTKEKQDALNEVGSLGARVIYKQVDVAEKKAVDGLVQNIHQEFGHLEGILHVAGLLRDNFILKKTKEEIQQVLAPKVSGLVHLDEASKELPLDFFVLFSSGAGALGNPGQVDYAAANAFMDAYAAYRNDLVVSRKRHGQTLSINWPLWKEGGMRVDEATETTRRESTGMMPMETPSGVRAFYEALDSGKSQVLVMEGDRSRFKQQLLEKTSKFASSPGDLSPPQIDAIELREKTLHQLKRLLGESIKLSVDRIDAQEPLESYGIDSIVITQLNQKLMGIFGEISKTLFFEYQTLGALTEYLVEEYSRDCMVWTGLGDLALQQLETPSAPLLQAAHLPTLASLKSRPGGARRFALPGPLSRVQEPIAIIGISGRYAQAENLDTFWDHLKAGKDCVTEIPPERWSLNGFFHPDPVEAVAQGKSYSKWGSFLEGFADFDPYFFNISPREAKGMDPQERLFLQACWEVLEDAGYTRERLATQFNRSVGVFVGITKTGFELYGPELSKPGAAVHLHTSFSSAANRISYFLNLNGPSMPIDTMCSSSLTAIHEACEHLRHGACELAIAGGVNLYLHPSSYIGLCAQNMLSKDGQCKSFGTGGNGFVPGEGVGAVLLKPLSRAIMDRDHIDAVIRGSSVNHGGKTNGYTVPNPKAQGMLIRETLEKAGVNARTVSYIEAHGTGTELGDPIEVTGLTQAFAKDTSDVGFCALGSVKSNLGHLEAAAGIAGLTKIVLQMKYGQLVPSLHAEALNPNINFRQTPFEVQQDLEDWQRPTLTIDGITRECPRIAGVSSFGAGGANAHVIVEEYRGQDTGGERADQGPFLIVLSAKTEECLTNVAQNLLAYLTSSPGTSSPALRNIAYTLQVGREAMEERLGLIVSSEEELIEKLKGFLDGRDDVEALYRGQVKRNEAALTVFGTDEDMSKIIDMWLSKGKYAKLLDLWVKGLVFDWDRLYSGNRPLRISLPTYPFAKERYWFERDDLRAGGGTASFKVASSTLEHEPLKKLSPFEGPEEIKFVTNASKPTGVSLVDPADRSTSFQVSSSIKKRNLNPLDHVEQSTGIADEGIHSVRSDLVELYDYGEGVLCIKVSDPDHRNRMSEQVLSGLVESFRMIGDQADAKVVMLTGEDRFFLSGETKERDAVFEQKIMRLILDCDIPVMAVMKGDASGMGWLMGSLCDFMVCSEESLYRYHDKDSAWRPSVEERAFFIERFGQDLGEELIASEKSYTGRALKEMGVSLPVLTPEDVDSYAFNMACELAACPRESLVLLKRHFSQGIAQQLRALESPMAPLSDQPGRLDVDEKGPTEKNWYRIDEGGEPFPDPGMPQALEISSEVVKAEAFNNGVVLITLCNKAGKNTFSEALVLGMQNIFEHIRNTPAYKAVVVTGYDHYFLCGGTLESVLSIQDGTEKYANAPLYELPINCDLPVIAAMQGHAFGAGWALGMFCDAMIFSEESVYSTRFMKFGFTPGFGSTLIFPHQLGQDLGHEILFTAREYKGHELKTRGIKMPVLPRSEVLPHAIDMASRMALLSREILVRMKNDRIREVRDRIADTVRRELAMHDKTFVGNQEVIGRVKKHFNEVMQENESQVLSVPESPEVEAAETDQATLESIRITLRETLADELHMPQERVDDDLPFIDMGLDSITGVTWVRKINEHYGLSLAATEVYNHPTLELFSDFLVKHGKEQGVFLASKRESSMSDSSPVKQWGALTLQPPRKIQLGKTVPTSSLMRRAEDGPKARQIQAIAVIGMSAQYPGARNVSEFWDNIVQSRDCISEVPSERWSIDAFYHADPEAPGKTYCKWMGVLEDADKFDPLFFNISPREAETMDPQQRLFLEACWGCIEDAGYDPASLSGSKCGVFVGCGTGDYGLSLNTGEMNAQALMGGSMSILAARISYLLNLQGPCVALDTACSSSLVAIASGCDSLTLGNSDLVLAGGVCVMAGPMMHVMTSKAGMLSPNGRCYTFDQRANGFVPSEGVGVVLLKRLEDATRDGDRIYGVIRGWGVNQDGKTNGITAPNGDAQTRLEKEVYDRYFINPEEIQMVEAHGTGTKLGDPIEVNGLKATFRDYTKQENYCALGSVKSNIGHALTAAGVAGVLKVLLSLKHRQLPPSIHFDSLNEHIQLEGSPFYVNTVCKDWDVPANQKRQAAVSSFGFSGTNAHMVIEECRAAEQRADSGEPSAHEPVAIVLSARNKDRLRDVARNLYQYLKTDNPNPVSSMADLAYTLQVGRAAMDERLGLIVSSVEELVEKLHGFLQGHEEVEDLYQGRAERKEGAVNMVGASAGREKYVDLLEQWVTGRTFAWTSLYGDKKPRRIGLPTYPFARERYWAYVDTSKEESRGTAVRLHPLVHENVSTIEETCFRSVFTGEEFFLSDHVVNGRKVLPGVAYLEMARAAVERAVGSVKTDQAEIHLRNIVWTQPMLVDEEPRQVHIGLYPEDNGQIHYEIGTESGVHHQGSVSFHPASERATLDLNALREACNTRHLTAEQCYKAIRNMAIDHGPSYQGIEDIYVGEGQLLARLILPAGVTATMDEFVLHPGLMDSALQAAIGLGAGANEAPLRKPSLPFALEELEVIGTCATSMWVWIRYADAYTPGDKVLKLNFDLCDDQGCVQVRMKGVSSRVLDVEEAAPALHPLIHQDCSTSEAIQFLSSFTGTEFFLADHVQMLPATAYIEMARAAGAFAGPQEVVSLKNIIWAKPLFVHDRVIEVFTALHREGDHDVFRISTLTGEREDAVIHCQGKLFRGKSELKEELRPGPLHIPDIRSRCTAAKSTQECAKLLQFTHGPGMLSIEQFQCNEEEALSKLKLPAQVNEGSEGYTLHPSMTNGAILTSALLSLTKDAGNSLPVPFSLDEVKIYGKLSHDAYAYAKRSPGQKDRSAGIEKYDIDLTDSQGNILVAFKGFVAIPAEPESREGIVYAGPQWQTQVLQKTIEPPQTEEPVFILDAGFKALEKSLTKRWPGARIKGLEFSDEDVAEQIQCNFLQVFELIRACMSSKPENPQPLIVLIPENDNIYRHAALSGLFKTARMENPKIVGRIIRYDVQEERLPENVVDVLAREIEELGGDVEIRYDRQGVREVKRYREINLFPATDKLPGLAPGSVIWITGGLGGLGQIFAQYLAAEKGCKVILSGRSSLNSDTEKILADLQKGGADIEYLKGDVGNPDVVKTLVRHIQKKYGKLCGVLHSAGVVRDAFIHKKTPEEIQAVLWPKVSGILAIEEATRGVELDFVVLFSAGAGALGNLGQADYAGANAFLDTYAEHRNQLVEQGKCFGKTISLNWPLWKEGGMGIDDASETMMRENTGLAALDTTSGIDTFLLALGEHYGQILVLPGDTTKIRSKLLKMPSSLQVEHQAKPALVSDNDVLFATIEASLIKAISTQQKIKLEIIELDTELPDYGFDSIGFTELANRLNKIYGLDLMPTVFFEHSTVRSLGNYLIQNYLEPLRKKYPASPEAGPTAIQTPKAAISGARQTPERFGHTRKRPVPSEEKNLAEPIAIVGMSGRFPQAKDLDGFWQNVKEGRDCISGIPKDRWGWESVGRDAQSKRVRGGFIDGIDEFDPLFFGISPKEAELMDPQQRLLMSYAWLALENAGSTPKTLTQSRTGVFAAMVPSEYMNIVSIPEDHPLAMAPTVPSMTPNRISHALNLCGPSEYCETACSSSFVALHRAIQSIERDECEQAVVCAVHLFLSPKGFIGTESTNFLSSQGQTRSFQADADGYVRSEGVGAIIIKPLRKAVEDKDFIYAVIKGTGVSHGGKGISLTAPNVKGMKAAIAQAYKRAGIDPRTVSYMEAHGIASPMADGLEIEALKSVFREFSDAHAPNPQTESPCYISSLKPCIGHGEIVSGMAALMKAVFAMHDRVIPGIPRFTKLHEHISLTGSPLRITAENQPWDALPDGHGGWLPRRASLNSYGFGGVNAHIVLEEYVPSQTSGCSSMSTASFDRVYIMPFSAKTRNQLQMVVQNILDFVTNHLEVSLGKLAYTLQVGREAMAFRIALVVASMEELKQGLSAFLCGEQSLKNEEGSACSIYTGSPEDRSSEIKTLLSGKTGEMVLQSLIEENNFEKLALYWTQGGLVPWTSFHEGKNVCRIFLPPYPFSKKSYGLSIKSNDSPRPEPAEKKIEPDTPDRLVGFLAEITGVPADEIKPDGRLSDYGVDSLLGMRLLNRINAVFGTEFDASLLTKATIQEVADEIGQHPVLNIASEVAWGSRQKEAWARPSFIETVEWDVGEDPGNNAANESDKPGEQLQRLIERGVGVWKEEGKLCFEFYKNTQTQQSLQTLVTHPETLLNELESGKRYYPTSSLQKFTLHETEVKKRATFNLGQGFWIDMPVRPALLNQAFNDIVAHHSILRTGAQLVGESWMQVVHEKLAVECHEIKWPDITNKKRFRKKLEKFERERHASLFDVDKTPLLDVYLIHNEKRLGVVFFHTHHFHADGFTLFLFQQELYHRYQALLNDKPYASTNLMAEYAHLALSQFGPERDAITNYWIDKLRGKRSNITFQDQARFLQSASGKTGVFDLNITNAMLKNLQGCNQRNNTTLTQLVTCAIAIIMYRLTKENMPIQMVYNLRDRLEFETLLGDFSSSLPVILNLEPHHTIRDVFLCYEKTALDLQRYKRCDFLELEKQLAGEGHEPHGGSLLGSLAVDSNDRDTLIRVTDFANRMIDMSMDDREPVAPLLVCIVKTHGKLTLPLIYDKRCFSHHSIQLLGKSIISLFKTMIKNPELPIEQIEIPISGWKRNKKGKCSRGRMT